MEKIFVFAIVVLFASLSLLQAQGATLDLIDAVPNALPSVPDEGGLGSIAAAIIGWLSAWVTTYIKNLLVRRNLKKTLSGSRSTLKKDLEVVASRAPTAVAKYIDRIM